MESKASEDQKYGAHFPTFFKCLNHSCVADGSERNAAVIAITAILQTVIYIQYRVFIGNAWYVCHFKA